MLGDKKDESTLEESTRALLNLQATLRHIETTKSLVPEDNRLAQAEDILRRVQGELLEYTKRKKYYQDEDEKQEDIS
ncbi:MAG: hypothetical protein J6M92_05310 [Oribacterium sp.]|nr:hypothetical protein [Oribacterium sp.]